MTWQCRRLALLLGVVLALTAATRADHHLIHSQGGCCEGSSTSLAAPAATTVMVDEWVPEQYQSTRTVYRAETRQETYTAYRTECVPETRTINVTSYRMVPETVTEMRTTCVKVPVTEQRTVYKTKSCLQRVTVMERKCEDHGQYVCKEVPAGPSLHDRLGKCFKGLHGCKNDCCEPACEPVRMKTVKEWCPNPVWVEKPVTHLKWVTEQIPQTICVTTCRTETRCEPVTVTRCRCIPETKCETITVTTKKCVPYQATRCVTVCVPHQETVTCCRMVCRKVAKTVSCAPAAPAAGCCAETCLAAPADCCTPTSHFGLFRKHGCK